MRECKKNSGLHISVIDYADHLGGEEFPRDALSAETSTLSLQCYYETDEVGGNGPVRDLGNVESRAYEKIPRNERAPSKLPRTVTMQC